MHEARQQSAFLDKCGIALSGLCAVHCLALPFLIPLIPFLAGLFITEHWFERTILISSLVLGAIAMTIGMFRHHGKFHPLILAGAGGVIYWFKDAFGHELEPIAVCVGAALIIYGHALNIKLIQKCRGCASGTSVDQRSNALSDS